MPFALTSPAKQTSPTIVGSATMPKIIGGVDLSGLPTNSPGTLITTDAYRANVQNPFISEVAKIVNPVYDARTSGGLTYQQASDASSAFENAVTSYFNATQDFGQKGGSKSADFHWQAIQPAIQSWRDAFAADLKKLKPTTASPTPPSKDTSIAPIGQRKTGTPQGRQSTILGGSGMAAPQRRTTIIGY